MLDGGSEHLQPVSVQAVTWLIEQQSLRAMHDAQRESESLALAL